MTTNRDLEKRKGQISELFFFNDLKYSSSISAHLLRAKGWKERSWDRAKRCHRALGCLYYVLVIRRMCGAHLMWVQPVITCPHNGPPRGCTTPGGQLGAPSSRCLPGTGATRRSGANGLCKWIHSLIKPEAQGLRTSASEPHGREFEQETLFSLLFKFHFLPSPSVSRKNFLPYPDKVSCSPHSPNYSISALSSEGEFHLITSHPQADSKCKAVRAKSGFQPRSDS